MFIFFRTVMYVLSWISVLYLRVYKSKIVDISKEFIFLCLLSSLVAITKIYNPDFVSKVLLCFALVFPYIAVKYILADWYYINK